MSPRAGHVPAVVLGGVPRGAPGGFQPPGTCRGRAGCFLPPIKQTQQKMGKRVASHPAPACPWPIFGNRPGTCLLRQLRAGCNTRGRAGGRTQGRARAFPGRAKGMTARSRPPGKQTHRRLRNRHRTAKWKGHLSPLRPPARARHVLGRVPGLRRMTPFGSGKPTQHSHADCRTEETETRERGRERV